MKNKKEIIIIIILSIVVVILLGVFIKIVFTEKEYVYYQKIAETQIEDNIKYNKCESFKKQEIEDEKMMVKKNTIIKDGAGFDCNIKARINKYDIVDILDYNGEWYKVKFNDIEGYIYYEDLVEVRDIFIGGRENISLNPEKYISNKKVSLEPIYYSDSVVDKIIENLDGEDFLLDMDFGENYYDVIRRINRSDYFKYSLGIDYEVRKKTVIKGNEIKEYYNLYIKTENTRKNYEICLATINKAKEIVNEIITEDMTEKEALKVINDYLVDTTTYTLDYWSAYNILLNGAGKCSGYARAFELLSRTAGIYTQYVAGKVEGQQNSHAWNVSYIDGEAYYTDVTWNDNFDKERYLLLDYDEMFNRENEKRTILFIN